MTSDAQSFHRIVADLDYPMVIVTAATGTEMSGCLVGFHTQCSIDPPRMLVCISRRNRTCTVAAASDMIAVHFLDQADHPLSVLFGEQTGDATDKFGSCSWHTLRGLPILDEVQAWTIGRVLNRIDLGDHIGHLLEPVEAHQSGPLQQLSFQQVKDMRPGHP